MRSLALISPLTDHEAIMGIDFAVDPAAPASRLVSHRYGTVTSVNPNRRNDFRRLYDTWSSKPHRVQRCLIHGAVPDQSVPHTAR